MSFNLKLKCGHLEKQRPIFNQQMFVDSADKIILFCVHVFASRRHNATLFYNSVISQNLFCLTSDAIVMFPVFLKVIRLKALKQSTNDR